MHVDVQAIGSFCTGVAAITGVAYGVFRRANVINLFKRQMTLIGENRAMIMQLRIANEHAQNSIAAMDDYKNSVDALRVQIAATDRRLNELEGVRPLYDAFVLWVPKVLEYVVWIETLAKSTGLDLHGRAMPPLPATLVKHFSGVEEK